MKTYCELDMEFVDTTAMSDGTFSTNDNQNFGAVEKFPNKVSWDVYGTEELNQFILDGTMEIMPDLPGDVVFWSSAKSKNDCTFSVNPKYQVLFTTAHSSAGLTLYFVETAPKKVKIVWYMLDGTKITDDIVEWESGFEIRSDKKVENYGKIVIEFIETQLPFQYIKCYYLQFGFSLHWGKDDIKSAKIVEDLDITSETLAINTASVSIIDLNNEFDLTNEDGTWTVIQRNQEIAINGNVNGESVSCGTFFIDTWKSERNVVEFKLIDPIGYLDKTKYYDGTIYNKVKASVIIASIMQSAGYSKYSVSSDIGNVELSGHIPVCSHRQALQLVCFACGAVADCSRSSYISIYAPGRYVSCTIPLERKFTGTKISIDDYFSGVSIAFNKYTLSDSAEEIITDTFKAGVQYIEFSEPYLASSITVSAGTIIEVKTNYVKVSFSTDDTDCTISGRRYISKEVTYKAVVDQLDVGEVENIKKFSGCNLFDYNRAKEVAQYILNYYQLRQIVTMRYLLEQEKVGIWASIKNTNGVVSTTGITKQTIDLTGGFIAEAVCRGYSKVTTDYYYADSELYADWSVII